MRRSHNICDAMRGGVSAITAKRGLRPAADVISRGAAGHLHDGGVALEKLREKVALQEKWTSGYRQIVDTIIRMVPRDISGAPDLSRIPSHTKDVLLRTEQSLAREGAILEQMKSELKCAEYLQYYRCAPAEPQIDRSSRHADGERSRITTGITEIRPLEESLCFAK